MRIGVVVTREEGRWLADVSGLRGRTRVRAASRPWTRRCAGWVVLADSLPDEAMPDLVLDCDYHAGDPDLDATAVQVRLGRQAGELAVAAPRRHRPGGPPGLWLVACRCAMSRRCWGSAAAGVSQLTAGPADGPGRAAWLASAQLLLSVTGMGWIGWLVVDRVVDRVVCGLWALWVLWSIGARHQCRRGARGGGPCLW